VLAEDAEYLLLGNAVVALDPGVEVGDDRDRRIAHRQLASEDRLRMTCHIDDGAADARVPPGLRPGGESRPSDEAHGAARNVHPGLDGRSAGRTVGVGEVHVDRAAVVERLDTSCRTVDELVREHERARPELRPQATDGAGGENLAYADRVQGP